MLKKLINFNLILISIVFITSCGGLQNRLDTPYINYDEDTSILTWDLVENATEYEIYINDDLLVTVNTTSYKLNVTNNDIIKVKAIDNTNEYANSRFSNVITISKEKKLVSNYFMINDTHGAFIDDGTPGIGRVGGLLDTLENSDEYIKIANGDIFQGSYISNILRGLPLVEALNSMDFDAFVLGNHEFDWGLDQIALYKDGNLDNGELNCPILGANVVYKNTNQIVDFLDPYTIVESNGNKIGIIGVIGEGLESSILTSNVSEYRFLNPVTIIEKYAKELRIDYACDSVVVSIHGFSETTNKKIANLSDKSKIDAIFCGHTHQKLSSEDGVDVQRSDGVTIPVIQNSSQNVTAAVVSLFFDNNFQLERFESKHYYPRDYAISSNIQEIINQYQTIIDEGNRVIGNAETYLSKNILGQMITEAMVTKYQSDFAIINTGGVRSTLSKNITVADVFSVLPFDNVVLIVNIKGKDLVSLYESNYIYLYINNNYEVSKIETEKNYKLAVIDYVYTSPYYSEFKNLTSENTNDLIRDVFIEYLETFYSKKTA